MKKERKIYDSAFKSKAVALSNERTNISELARVDITKDGQVIVQTYV